jgi:hypothetical protein
MNINRITLADKTFIDYTGRCAFYPNDEHVQRTGLKIDHIVHENAANYNPNLYTEEAIRIISQTL